MAARGAHGAIHVELPNFNPFASDEPRRGGGRPSRHRSDDEAPVPVSDDRGITVLPNHNPFGREPERVIRRGDDPAHRSLRPGNGRRQASRVPSEDEGSDNGMITLPSHNPFGPAPESGGQRGAQRSTKAPVRRHRSPSVSEGHDEEPGTTVLPSHNPFGPDPGKRSSHGLSKVHNGSASEGERAPAARRAATMPTRVRTPVESEQESVYEEPAPRARRKSQPKREEPVFGGDGEERMVISYVGGVPTARPAGIPPKPGRRPVPFTYESSVISDSDSGVVSGHHSHRHRSRTDRHRHHHHSHHRHCDCHHHQHGYSNPFWYPPFPGAPYAWPDYHNLPRQPHRPFTDEFGRPLYANIPQLPSLIDQVKETYPSLPITPTALLAELQARKSDPLVFPPAVPAAPITPQEFGTKLLSMVGDAGTILSDLEPKIFKTEYAEQVLRKLTDTVQVRFAERQGSEIVNRVHVVPRGRLALGIMSAAKPKLDVDLVIPSDFILRRWNVQSGSGPVTIASALGLDPASIARGEVDAAKLDAVITAVWEQLSGLADGFIFPGGAGEGKKYLPHWCDRYKESKGGNRLRLTASGVGINVFVKVAVSLYGQDVIVGVDQSSAKIGDKYQLIKVYRTPGVPLNEAPLSHAHRTAVYVLLWARDICHVPLRSNHIYLTVNALLHLDPSDALYLAPAGSTSSRISGIQVIETLVKILIYIGKAYAPAFLTPGAQYPFILSSCTTMDAMYTQMSAAALTAIGVPLAAVVTLVEAAQKGLGAVKGATNGASAGTTTGAGAGSSSAPGPSNGDSSPATGGAGDADAAGVTETGNGADADNAPPETSEAQGDPEPVAAETEGTEDGGVITAEPEQQPEDSKGSKLTPSSAGGGGNSRTTTPTPRTSRTGTGMVPQLSRPGPDSTRRPPPRTPSQTGTPSRKVTRQPTNK